MGRRLFQCSDEEIQALLDLRKLSDFEQRLIVRAIHRTANIPEPEERPLPDKVVPLRIAS